MRSIKMLKLPGDGYLEHQIGALDEVCLLCFKYF